MDFVVYIQYNLNKSLSVTEKLHQILLLFGTVYLPSAETALDLLLRHSENISKLICSKQPL